MKEEVSPEDESIDEDAQRLKTSLSLINITFRHDDFACLPIFHTGSVWLYTKENLACPLTMIIMHHIIEC